MNAQTDREFQGKVAEFTTNPHPWLSRIISTSAAAGMYVLFTVLVFWPFVFGKRFFWEDFSSWEYPIRDYCYYMFGLKHTLPFWNPYNWSLPAVLADGQNGFWYPTNILSILVTRMVAPSLSHLPMLVPELITVSHFPLAALGVFYLLKKHFHVAGTVALLAGFTFGFGSRIISDQNHPMVVYQLALLPWGTLLLLRSWSSWRSTIGLGLILGLDFLAGQPQVFLFTSFFFFCYTLAECLIRRKEFGFTIAAARPFFSLCVAVVIASGIAAVQLLPSLELAGISARSHLNYYDASRFGIHPGGLMVFLVPKMFAESGDAASLNQAAQATFYWSLLAEIFALFALAVLWKHRHDRHNARTRHVWFMIGFCLFAITYAIGEHFPIHWLVWKFVPLFDRVRAPARMLWFVWLLGTILGGIGLKAFLTQPAELQRHRSLLLWCSIVVVLVNLLAVTGTIDVLFFPGHLKRPGISTLLFPSLMMSVLVAGFLLLTLYGKLGNRWVFPLAVCLILIDLYYNDFTQQHNTVSRDMLTAEDAANPAVIHFFQHHSHDQAKLIWLQDTAMRRNLSMILRLRIEDAIDSNSLRDINPMRIVRPFPPTADSEARAQIMGAAGLLKDGAGLIPYPNALPFVKLYSDWRVTPADSGAAKFYADPYFDIHKTLLISESPGIASTPPSITDTAILTNFSENELLVTTHTSAPAMLLVNDLFYPAWHAYVDGNPVKIVRAFTSLRSIPVPTGTHRVEMKYESSAFEAGWKITLGMLVITILGLVFGRKQKNPEITRGSSI